MKTILTSVLLASAVFCMAATENNSKAAKAARKASTTVTETKTEGKKIDTDKQKAAAQTKEAKRKAKQDNYMGPWINNNGGGNTSYH